LTRYYLRVGALVLFGVGVVTKMAGADGAPPDTVCNATQGGILDEKETWVLTATDRANEGDDYYQVMALSAWAKAAGYSEYCLRWELENKSPDKSSGNAKTPTNIKNVWWADVNLYKDVLKPGGPSERASTWLQRPYAATPID